MPRHESSGEKNGLLVEFLELRRPQQSHAPGDASLKHSSLPPPSGCGDGYVHLVRQGSPDEAHGDGAAQGRGRGA